LKANIKRHIISLWRNKKSFVLELIACTVTFFVYTLFIESVISNDTDDFRMNMLLTESKIYFLVDPKLKQMNFDVEKFLRINDNHLWGSQFYHNKKKLNLINGEKEFGSDKTFEEIINFDDFIFKEFSYHNLKAALYFKASNDTSYAFEIYTLFNSAAKDYSFTLKSWMLSNFLKYEYEINSDFIVISFFLIK